jgi:ABC-type transport system involved in multi-copper enzyme maturation permease subunit
VKIGLGVLIGVGIPIVIMGLMIGFPLAVIMSKCRILRWWSTTSVGAVVGSLFGFMFSYGAWRGPEPGGVENPFMFTFSPVHWHGPGFTDGITFTLADLIASVSLAAAVGAALGLSFWYFHSRATR